jgi:two-component system alkaline phosphatase synthesis response regulator PhoP
MLPGIDGYDVLRTLKTNLKTASIPVIMLSAKGDVLDKVLGLELGADDYVSKPFSPKEVMSRVKAHLRRKQNPPPIDEVKKEISIKNLVIMPYRYQAFLDGKKLELAPKEFELLHLMAANPGRIFTRDILLEKIWGYDRIRETRTVDVHIRHLRQKIEKDPGANPEYIETVRCVGYRMRSYK